MPRKKWIDKSQATTYQLVHRPQNDPLVHDAEASSMVLSELAPTQAHKNKIKSRADLECELFADAGGESEASWEIRENEGEAAEYGIFYDDTEYDYMQHLRDLCDGSGNGEAYFVELPTPTSKQKGKGKTQLAEALQELDLDDSMSEGGVKLPSVATNESSFLKSGASSVPRVKNASYQDQQDVPDELAGFQPDMDPRLREVLEALEDDAYVDDEEGFFGRITQDREEVSKDEFETSGANLDAMFDEEGWESDETEKPAKEYRSESGPAAILHPDRFADAPDHGDGDWMAEFSKFKRASKAAPKEKPPASLAEQSAMTGLSTASGHRRKRKGAKTSTSGYSMTSSSLARTEGQTLLDARFDKIEEMYNEDSETYDEDEDGLASIMTGHVSNTSDISGLPQVSGSSRAPAASNPATNLAIRKDFDEVMDDFLGTHSMNGKRRIKKGKQTGLEQLDEIRRELGRPNIDVKS